MQQILRGFSVKLEKSDSANMGGAYIGVPIGSVTAITQHPMGNLLAFTPR